MITKIRSSVDHIIVRIILVIVALSFVGFGGVSLMSGNSRGMAVSFSEAEPISMEQFLLARNQEIDAIQKQNGINLTDEQIEQLNINRVVLQKLVSNEMMKYIAKTYDFDISDEQVIAFAKASPMFRNADGEFDPQLYKNLFAYSRNNEKDYLDFIKKQIINNTIAGVFVESFKVPDLMTENIANAMAEIKDVTVYKLDLAFKDTNFQASAPSKEVLHDVYNKHQDAFTLPEKRAFRYIKVSKEFLSRDINVTEQDMKKYFAENPEEFDQTDYTQAKSDIKKMLMSSKLDEVSSALLNKLEDEIASGMSLEDIANKYKLKIIQVKDTDKQALINSDNDDYVELADHIFEMISGETSYPIEKKDMNEILICSLDSIIPSRVQEFDEVENAIIDSVHKRELAIFNMNKFIEFSKQENLSKNVAELKKNGIVLIKLSSLSPIYNDEIVKWMPKEMLVQIFQINDNSKTKIFTNNDGVIMFAYIDKSSIDNKKKKKFEEQELAFFHKSIKDSLLQEMIMSAILKNNIKVHLDLVK